VPQFVGGEFALRDVFQPDCPMSGPTPAVIIARRQTREPGSSAFSNRWDRRGAVLIEAGMEIHAKIISLDKY